MGAKKMDGGKQRIEREQVIRLRLDQVSLFLDLDGTLAEFADRPDLVGADIARNALLRELAVALDGRMAVVSGRSIEEVDRILEGSVIAVAGSHGLERRNARLDRVAVPPHPALRQVTGELRNFAGPLQDTLIEEKPLSVAFHYRGNPSFETTARIFAEDLAARTGLVLQHGAMVVEFLTPGTDKGEAIRAFMAESPFAGTVPLFAGDDLTDESGFHAVRTFGGFGVLVGTLRFTGAAYRLDSVEAVQAWLRDGLQSRIFTLEIPVEPSYRCF